MELFDYFMNLILDNTDIKDSEIANVRYSLMRSVEHGQYMQLFDDNDKFLGFVTWELKDDLLGITNLLLLKRGTYNLKRIISFLSRNNPGVRFTWKNRKRNRIFLQREATCIGN